MTQVRLQGRLIVYYQYIFVIHVRLTIAVDQEREIVEHMLESKWATALTHIGVYVCIRVFELETLYYIPTCPSLGLKYWHAVKRLMLHHNYLSL